MQGAQRNGRVAGAQPSCDPVEAPQPSATTEFLWRRERPLGYPGSGKRMTTGNWLRCVLRPLSISLLGAIASVAAAACADDDPAQEARDQAARVDLPVETPVEAAP